MSGKAYYKQLKERKACVCCRKQDDRTLAGRVLCATCNENSRGIVSALNTNMLTATETTHVTGGCNVNTNSHNAVSRLPKVNIIVVAPYAERNRASGQKKSGKRKRPLRAATLKRSDRKILHSYYNGKIKESQDQEGGLRNGTF